MENTENSVVANIDDIPNHLNDILKGIRQGKEIFLSEHDRIIAKIIPVSSYGRPEKWPDFFQRASGIFGKYPKTSASESLMETREERF